MTNKKITFISIIILYIIIFTINIWASENIHIGQIQIYPAISLREGYNSNIYLNSKNIGSSIHNISSGVYISWPYKHTLLDIDYDYSLLNYTNEDAEDWRGHRLNAKLNTKLGKSGYTFDVNGIYSLMDTTEPEYNHQTAAERRETKTNLSIETKIKDRISLGIKPTFLVQDYNDPNSIYSRKEIKFSTSLGIKFLPKTSGLLEYNNNKIDYDNNDGNGGNYRKNNIDQSIMSGISWDATAKLNGSLKAGYAWRNFDDTDQEKIATWTTDIDLTHKTSPYTTGYLSYQHYIDYNFDTISSLGDNWGKYSSDRVNFRLEHELTYKIKTSVNLLFNYNDYKDYSRIDRIFQCGINFIYVFREWISANLSYNYRERNTNNTNVDDINVYDYNSNTVFIGTTLAF